MKAAVYVGESTALSLEQVKPNPPGPRDVIVEIGASGVCHSDLSIMRGYVPVPPGMVLGHEGAGRVIETGPEVSRVKKGDRVIASFVPACGVTTGVGAALNTAKVKPGSTVAVLGCGGVGQAVIQGARIAGAGRIIAIDPQELKRKTAKQLGATDTIDPSKGDPVEQVKALTGGRGADYAFEVIGLPETILTAYNLARRGGEVIIVGMARFDAQFSLLAFGIFFEEKTVRGCKYGSAQVRRD